MAGKPYTFQHTLHKSVYLSVVSYLITDYMAISITHLYDAGTTVWYS